MRLFFGLPLEIADAEAIAGWRRQTLPEFRRPVPLENFHLTLCFLGEVSSHDCRELCQAAENLNGAAFEIELDVMGFWPKNEICYLQPQRVPEALPRLAEDCRAIARRVGLKVEKRRYQPHLTLARRCETAPPEPLLGPDFTLGFDRFALFESTRSRRGVTYDVVEEFPLTF
jgi:2'-5' RNA ligase